VTSVPLNAEPGNPTASAAGPPEEHAGVSLWLVILVLVLLLAVAGVGAYVLRAALTSERFGSTGEIDIARAEQQVAASPDDAEAHVSLGYAYQQAGRHEDALAAYDEALTLMPGHAAALYHKGIALLELGRGAEAESALAAVVRDDPAHALAAKSLAAHYIAEERFAEVPPVLEPALEASPTLADLHCMLAYAYEQLGDTEEALEHYRSATAYDPNLTDAREGLTRLGVSE
jgi:tetratricopeptide (TPR) repeat protein